MTQAPECCGSQSSEECQKPQPPLLLKKVSQYTSHLYCNTPPICTAVLLVPLRSEEREILSVLLPFVSQYASHLYCNTPPICIAILLGKSWWLWSPERSPNQRKTKGQQLQGKIVTALFRTFSHFSTHFHSFAPGLLLKLRLFYKRKKKKTKPFCTLVVAGLSSSN